VIVPDLPVDEAGPWMAACAAVGVAPVFLAAPGTSDERLREVAAASRGFVYCVATYGVTGERESLSGTAQELVSRLRPLTGRPLLVGVGIGAPEQAALACAFADGVVVGSALVRPLLAGDRAGALELAERFRAAIAA
jgi:tryptophan synthase alpha chain